MGKRLQVSLLSERPSRLAMLCSRLSRGSHPSTFPVPGVTNRTRLRGALSSRRYPQCVLRRFSAAEALLTRADIRFPSRNTLFYLQNICYSYIMTLSEGPVSGYIRSFSRAPRLPLYREVSMLSRVPAKAARTSRASRVLSESLNMAYLRFRDKEKEWYIVRSLEPPRSRLHRKHNG